MVQIRKIEASDTLQVQMLINGILQTEFSAARKAYPARDLYDPLQYYSGKKDIFLVADMDGKIIGTAAVKEELPDIALLRRVFINMDFRGRGYGAELLNTALEFCRRQDYHAITFRGLDTMHSALKLCLQNGFKTEGAVLINDAKIHILTKSLRDNSRLN